MMILKVAVVRDFTVRLACAVQDGKINCVCFLSLTDILMEPALNPLQDLIFSSLMPIMHCTPRRDERTEIRS